MNYNLKVNMERVNGQFVTQLEVSGVGRAGRKNFSNPDFPSAMKQLQVEHDTMIGHVETYHNAPAPVAAMPEETPKTEGKKSGLQAFLETGKKAKGFTGKVQVDAADGAPSRRRSGKKATTDKK